MMLCMAIGRLCQLDLQAQDLIRQNVRGTVVDKATGSPLTGATVVIADSDPLVGSVTDLNGEFILEDIPVGRHLLRVDYMGYHQQVLPGMDVVSGKESVILVEMVEKVIMGKEITIRAHARKDQPLNEMAVVSARSFTVEETEKYAGSLGDPARMALSFAGVMSGSDQVNDIIIRGNSPIGLLWRLEGIHIPNPNHFGSVGSTGGPISMLNNNMLSNSDFFTGAFPAEYGNALSGVFDLRLRSGNDKKREHTFQVGLNGAEAGVEGPIIKGKGNSYLAHYRYSTLAALHLMGLNIGVMAIPYFQDLSFKIDFRTKNAGRWSVFGLGGLNHITLEDNKNDKKSVLRLSTRTGVAGISHTHFFNPTTRLKTAIAFSASRDQEADSVVNSGLLKDFYWDNYVELKYSFTSSLRKKFSAKDHLVNGITFEFMQVNYRDSIFNPVLNDYLRTINIKADLFILQAFSQWKHWFSDDLSLISGLHFQKVSLNNELALEPRASLNRDINSKNKLSLGYGLHSQMQPRMVYFEETPTDTLQSIYIQTNKKIGFTRSHHLVLGFQHLFNTDLRLKTEAYYQHLYHIPVKQTPSWISLVNYGGSFTWGDYDSLVNEGTGRNVGLEVTFEHFFSGNYYYLLTLSLFDSKYRASDGEWRNTAFNGNYICNLVGGYEFRFGKQNSFAIDARTIWAGGLRKVPIDLDRSIEEQQTIYDYSRVYHNRNRDFFRCDIRLSHKINRPGMGHLIAIDIQNITNRKNQFLESFDPDTGRVEQEYQIGILPIVLWRVYF
jgi:hypothetical protein